MNENDKDKILTMEEGKAYYFNMYDEGGAEIWKINNIYFLFEVPLFGGMPYFHKRYTLIEIDEMIKTYKAWT